MKVTTTRRVTHTLRLDDDTELEILFEPIDDTIVVERTEDKIKVGYLVQDDGHGSDPMKEGRCNGKLYYEREMDQSALGLDGYGSLDIDRAFDMPGRHYQTTLRDLALLEVPVTDNSSDLEQEDIERVALRLYQEHFEWICRWAVPVDYRDYGSGGSQFRISKWAGDINRLPNAVWVADKDARDSLEFEGKVPTRAEIEDYCKGVLEEYEKWCNGEVYGVVVETFASVSSNPPVGPWEKTDNRDNECWGHIGYGYAKEALAEAMQ